MFRKMMNFCLVGKAIKNKIREWRSCSVDLSNIDGTTLEYHSTSFLIRSTVSMRHADRA